MKFLKGVEDLALSGTPTAPTASSTTNSTQIATTAFVKSQGYQTAENINAMGFTLITMGTVQPESGWWFKVIT